MKSSIEVSARIPALAESDQQVIGDQLHRSSGAKTEAPCVPAGPVRSSRARIHWMPSRSRPLTGSSRISTAGSASRAAAMPSRWPMPSENEPADLLGHLGQADRCEHVVHASRPDADGGTEGEQVVAGAAAAVDRPWRRAARRPRPAGRTRRRIGRPLTSAAPAVGRSRPRIIRIVVDLPAPLGPRKPVTTPGRIVALMPSTASLSPYLLASCSSSIIGLSASGRIPQAFVVAQSGCVRIDAVAGEGPQALVELGVGPDDQSPSSSARRPCRDSPSARGGLGRPGSDQRGLPVAIGTSSRCSLGRAGSEMPGGSADPLGQPRVA